jgi:hypothetical protein
VRELLAYRAARRRGPYGPDLAPLFVSAWEAVEAAYFRALDAATAGAGSWREGFRSGARATMELAEGNPSVTRFLFLEAYEAGPLAAERQGALAARLAERIDTARAELAHPERVSAATAEWIVAIFFNRIRLWAGGRPGPGLAAQLPELLFLAVSAYYGTEAGLAELL